MIINYTKYFKDNFDFHFDFENKNYINLERKGNECFINDDFTYISSENFIKNIFNMKIFDRKVISIYDFKSRILVYKRIEFIEKRTLAIWKSFVKKKKCNRLGLKLLKITAPHLGNPIFMDFSV